MLYLEEKKYLNNNTSNNIECKLLKNISKKEIEDFIIPLYKEFNVIKKIIDKEVFIVKKDNKLNNLEKYFLELLIKLEIWWKRLEDLENILNLFNRLLSSRKTYKKSNFKKNKEIDIKDIPISQVIWKYIKLPNNLKRNIKCPLHKEKTWSFKIYQNTNSFYCFWCGKWWNSINFISEVENISTKEAFKKFIEYFY